MIYVDGIIHKIAKIEGVWVMKELKINLNTKVEVAIEIIASKIAEASRKGLTTKDEEMLNLLKERDGVYSGNVEIIDKILNIYGPEIKNKLEEV